MKTRKLLLVPVVLALAVMACSTSNFNPLGNTGINIDSVGDGKIRMETNLSLDLIQTALETAASVDDQMIGLTLESHDGFIYVHADELEMDGVTGTDVSYHLELSSVNGDLAAEISNVQSGNGALDITHFESYNEQIAQILTDDNGLEDITNFESVSITPEGVSVVVIIEAYSGN